MLYIMLLRIFFIRTYGIFIVFKKIQKCLIILFRIVVIKKRTTFIEVDIITNILPIIVVI